MSVGLSQRRVSSAARRRSSGTAVSDWSAALLVYTGCSAVQASGTGFSQYQSLSGANFAATVNSAPVDNVVSLQ